MSHEHQCDHQFEGYQLSKCSCSQCQRRKNIYQEEVQYDRNLFTNLNTIILQYLETCGLNESYRTFYKECDKLGWPQGRSPSPNNSSRKDVSNTDVDQLLKYFDNQDGTPLLKKWESIKESVKIERLLETENMSIYLRIYIALIPFRLNHSQKEKKVAMSRLLEHFQSKANESTDDEILGLFALPFIDKPETHPTFAKLFTKFWIDQLRLRLQALAMTLCQAKQDADPVETDLAKLFISWSHAIQHSVDMKDGSKWKLQTTPTVVTLSSGAKVLKQDLPKNSPLHRFFQNISELTDQNEHLQRAHSRLQKKYSRQIQLCDALVTCLQEVFNGKSINDLELQNKIRNVYPHPLLMESDSRDKISAKGELNANADFKSENNQKLQQKTNTQEIGDHHRQHCHRKSNKKKKKGQTLVKQKGHIRIDGRYQGVSNEISDSIVHSKSTRERCKEAEDLYDYNRMKNRDGILPNSVGDRRNEPSARTIDGGNNAFPYCQDRAHQTFDSSRFSYQQNLENLAEQASAHSCLSALQYMSSRSVPFTHQENDNLIDIDSPSSGRRTYRVSNEDVKDNYHQNNSPR